MPASALPRLVLLLAIGLTVACGTRDNPDTCVVNEECGGDKVCDKQLALCVPKRPEAGVPDAPVRMDGPADAGPDRPEGEGGDGDGDAGEAGEGGPPPCTGNQDCPQDGLRQCVEGRCVACVTDDHCDRDRPFCTPDNQCITCKAAMTATPAKSCPTERPHCDEEGGSCEACLTHLQCPSATAPLCGPAKTCVGCGEVVGGCVARGGTNQVCDSGSGRCVQCTAHTDCVQEGQPACVQTECKPCTRDEQCVAHGSDPGLCLVELGGRCARPDEVIYVRKTAPCADTAGAAGTPGSPSLPYCTPAAALGAVTEGRRVMLLRGPDALAGLPIAAGWPGAGGGRLLIVGQAGAAIAPGASVGVDIAAGDVTLRGLTIRDGEEVGVRAVAPATLRMDRVVVRANKKGGLLTLGAGFDVSNTVIDGNGPGSFPAGVANVPFGGVFLGAPTEGRTGAFRFNTVVNNKNEGVACGSTSQTLTSVLLWNNVVEVRDCQVTPTSRQGLDPLFDGALPPYHISSQSPCHNNGGSTSVPPHDLDGDPRPATASDCGADERAD